VHGRGPRCAAAPCLAGQCSRATQRCRARRDPRGRRARRSGGPAGAGRLAAACRCRGRQPCHAGGTGDRAHSPHPRRHGHHRGSRYRPGDQPQYTLPQAQALRALSNVSLARASGCSPTRTSYSPLPTMRLSFRLRIVLTLLPLLILLGVLGGAGTALLYRLGNRIDLILRENYDSVVYMQKLREATERIDSSFQFALVKEEEKALQDYEPNWDEFRKNLRKEQNNITLPGEK